MFGLNGLWGIFQPQWLCENIYLKKSTAFLLWVQLLFLEPFLENHTTHEKSALDFQKKNPKHNKLTWHLHYYSYLHMHYNPLYFKFVELK